jgi:hypothetical protein
LVNLVQYYITHNRKDINEAVAAKGMNLAVENGHVQVVKFICDIFGLGILYVFLSDYLPI